MQKNAKFTLLLQLFQSFLTTWALMKAARMEPGNILTFVFFLLVFFFYRHVSRRLDARHPLLLQGELIENSAMDISILHTDKVTDHAALTISVIYTLLYMLVDYSYYIELLTSRLYRFIILAVVFTGFVTLFYYLLKFLFSYTCNKMNLYKILRTDWQDTPYTYTGRCRRLSVCLTALVNFYRNHTALCSFLICLFCWLPYFLYQYPGIMTPDSINQFAQILGESPYSNHHPWTHTMLFGFFYHTGYALTGNMVAAVSCYTLFQMCLLSGSIAYFISTLRIYRIRPFILLMITAFYALIPYHAVFSVTIWKDIPFAAAVLFFGCTILRLTYMDKVRFREMAAFTLSGIMICLFRSNGWYAFVFALPFLLFIYHKRARVFYPALFIILCTAIIVKYPVMNAFHVEQPDFIESVCIPMQQITAVICNDRALSEEQLDLVENVVDLTYIKDLYNPTFADNIKELVRAGNQDYLTSHKKEFLKLWIDLGLRYPGDYLTAYVKQTYGYWYPDSFYLVAEAEGVSATRYGVSHTPLIGGPLVIKGKEIAIKLGSMVPIYGTLWSMGVACWIMIFSIGTVIIRREYHKLTCYLPSTALLLTVLIATPVATEFRYVYFMVFSLPFYLITAMLPDSTCPPPEKRRP
ncbi:hypothetical protein D7V83_03075 [bacterium 0.1xD8-71]|nr:hypothetical protein D7V83_03075 [bacterium 0.1xD8-71]